MNDTDKALAVLHSTIKAQNHYQYRQQASSLASLVRSIGFESYLSPDRPLTLEEALKLSAISICIDVLSQDFAKTPLILKERLAGGGAQSASGHWLADLLVDAPNQHMTWFELKEMVMIHLSSLNNAFIAKKIDSRGRTEELIPLLPGRVRILIDEGSGRYVYEVWHDTPHEKALLEPIRANDDRKTYLLHDEVIHLRSRVVDGLYGYSNLTAGSKSMGLIQALTDYQTRLYKNDASLRGVFQMKQDTNLSDDSFKRLRQQLGERLAKLRDEGAAIILEQGMEFNSIAMNADQAEATKAFDQAVVNAARLFRMPPHKMMHLINVKYENMETLEKSYAQDTMDPHYCRVEERLTLDLLPKRDRARYLLEFDREKLELKDPEKQAVILKVMLNNSAMTIDEARMKRGMNPLPNGAGRMRLVPSNMTLVDDSNNVVIPAGGQTDTESDTEPEIDEVTDE